MRASFGVKLGLAITLLTVGLSTASVLYFYSITSNLLHRQITGRLKNIGHVSTFLFDQEARESIVRLKAKLERESQITNSSVQQIKPGETLSSLTPESIRSYQSTEDFQRLTQMLRKINFSSRDEVPPLKDYYPQRFSAYPNSVLTYLIVTVPESPDRRVLRFLASFAPEPEGDTWAGNPIGNLYAPASPIFSRAFDGETQVAEDYYTDSFYTSITAVVPLKDRQGQTIAVLGLDYLAGSEQDQLSNLKYICAGIIALSLILSVVLSVLIARWLGQPIQQLQIAAQKVCDQNYELTLDVKRKDELGILAKIFNAMVADIRSYAIDLETKNSQLQNYSFVLEQQVQARTLDLQEVNQKLQELANLDGLTQIFNRRYFDEYLKIEWQRTKRTKSWIALILCDVDYFKLYNDTYGHQAGDECLQQITKAIHQCLKRPTDLVARYGGEEFILLLPNTNFQGALLIAEEIKASIKSLKIEHQASEISNFVTLSLGIASTIPEREQEPTHLIAFADKALYQAKQEGRNCISVTLKTQPNMPIEVDS